MSVEQLPLAGFERFRTSDLDEARTLIEPLLSAHTIEAARGRFDVRYRAVDLVESSVLYAEYGDEVRLDPGGCLGHFYIVGMPLAGSCAVTYGARSLVTHSTLASVQSSTRPVATVWHAHCRKLSIKIGRPAMERRLAQLLGHPPARPLEFELALDLQNGPGTSWRRLVQFLLAELSPTSAYLGSAAARRCLEDTIIQTLLFVQPHNYSAALRAEAPPMAPRHVRRVEELIAQNPALPHRLADLAEQVGVSIRALQAGFQRFRGMTPTQFTLQKRLEKAHADLLRADQPARVTEIALAAGFGHLGRFAQAYRERYGEHPSETLARRP